MLQASHILAKLASFSGETLEEKDLKYLINWLKEHLVDKVRFIHFSGFYDLICFILSVNSVLSSLIILIKERVGVINSTTAEDVFKFQHLFHN